MARQWVSPVGGFLVNENSTKEYVSPVGGALVAEGISGVTCDVSGTYTTATRSESDVASNSYTIILTVTGDTLVT